MIKIEEWQLREFLLKLDDYHKLKYIRLLKIDENKAEVLYSFASEELRFKYLYLIHNPILKIPIILSFTRFEYIVESLKLIDDLSIQLKIMASLEEDLRNRLFYLCKSPYILALSTANSFKLSMLNLVSLDKRVLVLIGLPDSIKQQYLESLSYLDRMALIYSFKAKRLRDDYRFSFEKKFLFDLGIDSTIRFGLEIEVEGVYADLFKKWNLSMNSFRGVDDASLVMGVEINSPKMKNKDESLSELYYVLNLLKRSGFFSSSRTGGHIHFDANYFDCKKDYYMLIELWVRFEKVFYLILNDCYCLPRVGVLKFAIPFKDSIHHINYSLSDSLFIQNIHSFQKNKYGSLNFSHVHQDTNTIEFRIPNGSLQFEVWMQNIKFLARLMMISKKFDQQLLDEIDKIDGEELKFKFLLDLLFSSKEQEVYLKRYQVNTCLLEKSDYPLKRILSL